MSTPDDVIYGEIELFMPWQITFVAGMFALGTVWALYAAYRRRRR